MRRLDAETLDRFYAELRKRGRGDGKPLSASQVRSVHTVLSGALKQAVAWGWISHNPARLATPPSLPRGEVTPPPVAQVNRLLALALERELRFGLFLRLAVVLGARRGELCGLHWRAIDLERGEGLLERGVVYVPGEPLIEKATKTRSKRRLALDARTVELLRAQLTQMQRTADELGSTLRADAGHKDLAERIGAKLRHAPPLGRWAVASGYRHRAAGRCARRVHGTSGDRQRAVCLRSRLVLMAHGPSAAGL